MAPANWSTQSWMVANWVPIGCQSDPNRTPIGVRSCPNWCTIW